MAGLGAAPDLHDGPVRADRPAQLTATVPCRALQVGGDVTVLATGPPGDGLVIRTGGTGPEPASGQPHGLPLRHGSATTAASRWPPRRTESTVTDGGRADHAPCRRTGAKGIRAAHGPESRNSRRNHGNSRTASVFATSPTTVKFILIVVQLLAVGVALVLLARTKTTTLLTRFRRIRRFTWRVVGVDVAVLVGAARLGGHRSARGRRRLGDDDRPHVLSHGGSRQLLRWWNASETPFAFSQQSLSLFTTSASLRYGCGCAARCSRWPPGSSSAAECSARAAGPISHRPACGCSLPCFSGGLVAVQPRRAPGKLCGVWCHDSAGVAVAGANSGHAGMGGAGRRADGADQPDQCGARRPLVVFARRRCAGAARRGRKPTAADRLRTVAVLRRFGRVNGHLRRRQPGTHW